METSKKGKRRIATWRLVLIILLLIGACIALLYAGTPLIFRLNKDFQIHSNTKRYYEDLERIELMKEEEHIPIPYEDLYNDCVKYNRNIILTGQEDLLVGPQGYQKEHLDLTEYDLDSKVFGVLTVPKLEIEMPIYLGANYQNMADGVAVMGGTSIPIGGSGTNCVIAGHRGWNGYPYFLYIQKMELGDKVYITNFWEELIYEVTEIKIIYPSDFEQILIQGNKDMVTLLTCHPPSTGGQMRYLVICERVEVDENTIS